MEYRMPDYYKEFKCTADACEDTCCAGWQIVIDRQSLENYQNVLKPGSKVEKEFRSKMLRSVNWLQGTFRQDKEKRCAFLNEKNLCDMYAKLGEKSLCKTCRLYPRHIEEFEGVREITLSVSCPEVARILMERMEPVKFPVYEKEGEEEYEDFDLFLYSMLADAREAMIRILQSRELPFAVRTGLVLGMAHDIQGRVNREEIFSCTDVIEKYETEEAVRCVEKWLADRLGTEPTGNGESIPKETAKRIFQGQHRYDLVHSLFRCLYDWELLRDDWDMLLMETEACLYTGGAVRYRKLDESFQAWQKEQIPEMEIHLEQLMVYFISTYFCGAVYDGRIYAKAQMAAVSVFLIREFWMARWKKNERTLNKEEMTEILYRYSRELEHSDENLECMEKQMEEQMVLTDW